MTSIPVPSPSVPSPGPDGSDSGSDSWPPHSPQPSQGDLIGCIACNTSYKQFPNVSPWPQPPLSRLRSSCFLAPPSEAQRYSASTHPEKRACLGTTLNSPLQSRGWENVNLPSPLALSQIHQSVLTILDLQGPPSESTASLMQGFSNILNWEAAHLFPRTPSPRTWQPTSHHLSLSLVSN